MLESHEHKKPVHDFDGITENRVNSPPAYFNILFYGLVIWGAVFIAYFLFSGWSSGDEFAQKMAAHQEQTAQMQPTPVSGGMMAAVGEKPDEDAGGELFASHCASCHGTKGEGGFGPDLTSDDYKFGRTPEAVRESISAGRPEGMPAFGNQLSALEIDALTSFVLEL